jgi:hypothetical protein
MRQEADSHASGRTPRAWLDPRRIRIGALVTLVLVIAVVLWLVFHGGGSWSTSPVPRGTKAVRISLKGLKTLARLGVLIYWVGQEPGVNYELTKTADNRVFIRYLPWACPSGAASGT